MSDLPVAIVTGGAGFIGSHMTEHLLNHGYEVRVLDDLSGGRLANLDSMKRDARLKVEVGDIRNLQPGDPLFRGADLVFHFAGKGDIVPSITQPVEYFSVNVMGTVKILEASRAAKVKRFVYAASSSCYGLAETIPTPETALIRPEYPYALSKYLGEEAVLHWGKVYKFPVNSIRIFNAYGPRARTTGAYGAVFGVFLAQKLAQKPFTVVGDGTQTRDFIYVSDLAEAFFAVANSDKAKGVYNVGAGKPQSINHLVGLLSEGKTSVVHVPRRPGEPDCTWADITRIKTETGWSPSTSFEDGVKKMLAVIEYWKDAPVWDENSIGKATAEWFAFLDNKR